MTDKATKAARQKSIAKADCWDKHCHVPDMQKEDGQTLPCAGCPRHKLIKEIT